MYCVYSPRTALRANKRGRLGAELTHSLRDQLDRADAGSWQIADGGDLRTARAQVTSVGDYRVRFVAEL